MRTNKHNFLGLEAAETRKGCVHCHHDGEGDQGRKEHPTLASKSFQQRLAMVGRDSPL